MILDDQGNHFDSYTISLESFRSFRVPLFRKPVTGQKPFFCCCFYSKPALIKEIWYVCCTNLGVGIWKDHGQQQEQQIHKHEVPLLLILHFLVPVWKHQPKVSVILVIQQEYPDQGLHRIKMFPIHRWPNNLSWLIQLRRV